MGKAMLDPKRDLKSATPEDLARALLRPRNVRRGTKAVVHDEAPVEKPVADEGCAMDWT